MQQPHMCGVHDASLLQSVAEQLRSPLTVIARQAELLILENTAQEISTNMSVQATTALTLVDNYLLGLQLLSNQAALELEPVSVSSILVDVTHALEGFATQYGVSLNMDIAGRYEPVMAHRQALRAALISLGFSLVEAISTQPKGPQKSLSLAVHKAQGGIVAGIYGPLEISATEWRRAKQLRGTASQPVASLLGTSGAGMFVADALGQAMETNVRVGRFAHKTGLAMTLLPSQQLQFI